MVSIIIFFIYLENKHKFYRYFRVFIYYFEILNILYKYLIQIKYNNDICLKIYRDYYDFLVEKFDRETSIYFITI